jgi:hypothetical protein
MLVVHSVSMIACPFCQQLVCFVVLALLLPQPAQIHHRPQFQRLRVLSAGNLDGSMNTLLCFLWDFGPETLALGL